MNRRMSRMRSEAQTDDSRQSGTVKDPVCGMVIAPDKAALLAHAQKSGVPELWAPRAVLVVGAIPVLGSGKVDLAATLALARQTRPLL